MSVTSTNKISSNTLDITGDIVIPRYMLMSVVSPCLHFSKGIVSYRIVTHLTNMLTHTSLVLLWQRQLHILCRQIFLHPLWSVTEYGDIFKASKEIVMQLRLKNFQHVFLECPARYDVVSLAVRAWKHGNISRTSGFI